MEDEAPGDLHFIYCAIAPTVFGFFKHSQRNPVVPLSVLKQFSRSSFSCDIPGQFRFALAFATLSARVQTSECIV